MKTGLKHLLNFRDYFQTESTEPIDFSGRQPPNLQHDLLYLSSYIHDAEFLVKQVELKKKKLHIPMERARWELYDSLGDLEKISSVLTVEPVEEITWELTGDLSESDHFIVSTIFFGEAFWDNVGAEGNLEIVIAGVQGSKLRLELDAEDMVGFRLVDLPNDNRRIH